MKLSNVLARINGSDGEKTASDSSTTSTASAEKSAATSQTADKLRAALKEATAPATPAVTKVASVNSPVADLTKLAAETVNMEHEALIKEAQFYGAACADGFMARLAQYNEAAEKIASQQPVANFAKVAGNDSFEKFASENPELVKEAAELGYASTTAQLEKLAESAYTKGYDEAVGTIYKTACDSFVSGYADTENLLKAIR